MQRDRTFLFGIFAVQLGKVTRTQLREVAGAWAADPSRDIAERLVEAGALDAHQRVLIDRLVEEAIRAHEGNVAATLETFGGVAQVNQSFGGGLLPTESGEVTTPAPPMFPGDASAIASLTPVTEMPGRYTHASEYGRGGMGRVLLVHDESLGRDIALKELLPREIGDAETTLSSPVRLSMHLLGRFIQEARPRAAKRTRRSWARCSRNSMQAAWSDWPTNSPCLASCPGHAWSPSRRSGRV